MRRISYKPTPYLESCFLSMVMTLKWKILPDYEGSYAVFYPKIPALLSIERTHAISSMDEMIPIFQTLWDHFRMRRDLSSSTQTLFGNSTRQVVAKYRDDIEDTDRYLNHFVQYFQSVLEHEGEFLLMLNPPFYDDMLKLFLRHQLTQFMENIGWTEFSRMRIEHQHQFLTRNSSNIPWNARLVMENAKYNDMGVTLQLWSASDPRNMKASFRTKRRWQSRYYELDLDGEDEDEAMGLMYFLEQLKEKQMVPQKNSNFLSPKAIPISSLNKGTALFNQINSVSDSLILRVIDY